MRLRDLLSGGAATRAGAASDQRPADWVPAGQIVQVARQEIPGGLIYTGHRLASVSGYTTEPALIDPSLAVDWQRPDLSGQTMDYWPSYSEIAPQARAAYLHWLAGGRRDPAAYVGYVFLFFYGLERRALVDLGLRVDEPEIKVIADETRRLIGLYGHHGSFGSYASEFLDLLDSSFLPHDDISPGDIKKNDRTWEIPLALRIAVARVAAEGKPLPPDWALAWLRHDPEAYLRTPAERCADEFDALFLQRYHDQYGEGLQLLTTTRPIRLEYRPASAGFHGTVEATINELPDVTLGEANTNALRTIAASCTDALDPLSRYLGRHPDGRDTPDAIGLLPQSLLEAYGGTTVRDITSWLKSLGDDFTVVAVDDLINVWSPNFGDEKIGKTHAVALASMLHKLGYGMEPDVRFGSPKPKFGEPVVLFRLPEHSPTAPSPEYTEAALLIRLSGLLAASDGHVSEEERRHLASHFEEAVGMDHAERQRVEASLIWLGTTGLQFSGLKRKLETLPQAQRGILGHFLVDVAMADGHVSPDEITTLEKLYRMLGLDEKSLYGTVHAIEAGEDRPTVILGATQEARHEIPEERTSLGIDRDRLAARRSETAEVAALLGAVFAEETSIQEPSPTTLSTGDSALGLDAAHAAVLAALPSKHTWSRSELETLVGDHGLQLVDAAIDRVNDAAIEHCDEPVLEGEEPWELNMYAVEALS